VSIEALSIVLNHSKARGAAKVILIGIANHLGPDAHEGAWPSQARLAGYANISDRAVRDAIDALVALGELRVEQAAGPSRNQYKPNRYWINLRCPESCDGTLGHNSRQSPARVEEIDNQGGSFPQSGWKPASDKPLEETIKKQHSSYRLPDDWQPKESDIELMKEHFPSIDLKLETHAFRDYWRSVAGAKGKKADWDATWRNWIRNSYKRNRPNNDLSHLNLED
jgi:hypothetical protein